MKSKSFRPFTLAEQELFLDVLNDGRSWPFKWTRSTKMSQSDWMVALESKEQISKEMTPKFSNLSVTYLERGRVPYTYFHADNWQRVPEPLLGLYTRKDYRTYVILHECGHALGIHGHSLKCDAATGTTPIMMQQTLGTRGCAKNLWPTQTDTRMLYGSLEKLTF